MWLRNFDNVMLIASGLPFVEYGNYQNGMNVNGSTVFGEGYVNAKAPNGTISNIAINKNSYFFAPAVCAKSSIVLGTGSTAVTYDDFKLSGDVIASNQGLSVANPQITYDAVSKKYSKVITITYTNTTASSVTISEWGIYQVNNNTSSTYTSIAFSNTESKIVLLYREVLSSPVVVAAGETVTLSLKLDFPMPNHP